MKINHIFRFEKLRDGGSLIVSFQADDSCEYWVIFPITSIDVKNNKFKEAILINRTTGIEVNLSLGSAKQWLKRLEPYFNQRPELSYVSRESEAEIFIEMLALCQSNT